VRLGIAILLGCRIAAADPAKPAVTSVEEAGSPPSPYAITATTGPRLTLLSGSALLGGVDVGASRRFQDRWHAGVRLELEVGSRVFVYEQVAEVGVWLHPSHHLDLLLAWRVGHAYFDFPFANVHALVLAPVVALDYRISRALAIRMVPFAINAYYSGLWQGIVSPEVGVAWRI